VRNPSILEAEFAAGKRSFTLGIEGISQRMRNYYQKGLMTEQVRKATISILERNARELKLFYIIAGLENSYDIEEFKAFCEEIARFKEQTHTTTRVIVSAGYLVRLPFTPLQYAPIEIDQAALEGIVAQMESVLRASKIEFRLASSFNDYYVDQLLSIGGSLFHSWLCACPMNNFVYDLHVSKECAESLKQFLGFLPKDSQARALLLEEKSTEYRPFFSFIEDETHWEMLAQRYEQCTRSLTQAPSSRAPKKIITNERNASIAIANIAKEKEKLLSNAQRQWISSKHKKKQRLNFLRYSCRSKKA